MTGKSGPLARVAIKREKERQLRHDLWELRDAIRFATRIWPTRQKSRSRWAPKAPDLETLVEGVDVGGKRYRLLRRIPIDPMTNRIMQSLIAALAGWNVPFVCTETHELGAEIVASYLYQVPLYHWLDSNGHGRYLAVNDL